jgi:hypothetical protein
MDAAEAERREVMEVRFTSLDRRILRAGTVASESGDLRVSVETAAGRMTRSARVHEQHVAGRLAFSESMGLAAANGPGNRMVRRDLESVLRGMQCTNDRQKTLFFAWTVTVGCAAADRSPSMAASSRRVQGRILVHGQEEFSGRGYLMREGTDAYIHFIQYTPERDMPRTQGGLRTNSFVRLWRIFGIAGEPTVDVQEAGDSEQLLGSRSHFEAEAQKLIKRGIQPAEDGWPNTSPTCVKLLHVLRRCRTARENATSNAIAGWRDKSRNGWRIGTDHTRQRQQPSQILRVIFLAREGFSVVALLSATHGSAAPTRDHRLRALLLSFLPPTVLCRLIWITGKATKFRCSERCNQPNFFFAAQ